MQALKAQAAAKAAKAKELAAAGAAKAEKLAAAGAAKAAEAMAEAAEAGVSSKGKELGARAAKAGAAMAGDMAEAAKAVASKAEEMGAKEAASKAGEMGTRAAKAVASKAEGIVEEVGARATEAVDNTILKRRMKTKGLNRKSTIYDMTKPGFTSLRQRHMCTEKELRSTGFKGHVRMICVSLDYEGTASPLGCTVDSERISTLARKSGCGDITKLYDNGSTPLFPSRDGLARAITEVGGRCRPDDYLVVTYSGHGASKDNPEAPSGVDCLLCLRTVDGYDEFMVDDELGNLITAKVSPKVRILVLVDACHSGGILDMDTPGLWAGRRVCCISGCKEGQLSTDSGDGGVMTNALLQVLTRRNVRWRRKKRNLSVQFVFNRMVAAMPEEEEEDDDDEDEDSDWEDCGVSRYWDDLSGHEQECASFLGFTKRTWDARFKGEELLDVSEEDDDEDAPYNCYWDDLSEEEQGAAWELGFTQEEWDDEDDGSEDEDEECEDDHEKGQNITLSWPAGQDPCKITFPF